MKIMIGCLFMFTTISCSLSLATDRTVALAETSGPSLFCDEKCGGVCYHFIKAVRPFKWNGANHKCKDLAEGGHLANVYGGRCYSAIRQHLLMEQVRGEVLIGMTYRHNPSGKAKKLNMYRSSSTITNPRWYRNRPNRIGEREMVMIVSRVSKFSGLRNILNGRGHRQVLCEIQKK